MNLFKSLRRLYLEKHPGGPKHKQSDHGRRHSMRVVAPAGESTGDGAIGIRLDKRAFELTQIPNTRKFLAADKYRRFVFDLKSGKMYIGVDDSPQKDDMVHHEELIDRVCEKTGQMFSNLQDGSVRLWMDPDQPNYKSGKPVGPGVLIASTYEAGASRDDKALDNVFRALDSLYRAGLDENTPVLIMTEGMKQIQTTVKSVSGA